MAQILPGQLDRISRGDEHAFRELVHHFSDRLYQYALSIVKNSQDTEEIIADVFFKLWLNKSQLPESDHLSFYLYRAVKNTALNYLKKQNRKAKVENTFYIELNEAHSPSPEDILISRENMAKIQDAINRLPLRCRQIFILVKEDGLTYQQVAELLDISPATVNVQMTIAIKKLWQTLDIILQEAHL